VKPY